MGSVGRLGEDLNFGRDSLSSPLGPFSPAAERHESAGRWLPITAANEGRMLRPQDLRMDQELRPLDRCIKNVSPRSD